MPEPTLTDILTELRAIRTDLDATRQRLEDEVKRWDERFFQLAKENRVTGRTIIVTAGAVVILSPVLQAAAPAIQTLVDRLLDP
ncbi:MAG: hypothetical protein EA373_00125 [Oceanospirillales bacterium]|nr:MAG: hypothetical protein EA373_00125 [Oceanospirillales bacterium]